MPADAKGKFTIEQRREQVAQLYLAGANQTATKPPHGGFFVALLHAVITCDILA